MEVSNSRCRESLSLVALILEKERPTYHKELRQRGGATFCNTALLTVME